MMNQQVFASIITIGDELLIGQTIDTNSAWMAQELNKIGVWVKRRVAVGDTREDIWQALGEESKSAQLLVEQHSLMACCRALFASSSERSANCRQTEVFERIAGSLVRCSIQFVC